MTNRVVTLTFSPALDVATTVDVVAPAHKLRCAPPRTEPGGGGVNVARVASRLGIEAVAIAPLGGDDGQLVSDLLAAEGVTVHPVSVDRPVRESFSVTETSSGEQYRFVLPPQLIDAADAARCIEAVRELGATAGCVVVSGSIDLPNVADTLAGIVEAVRPTPVIIDTSGDALHAALRSGALLVKPSARELSNVVGRQLDTEHDVVGAASETIAAGTATVLTEGTALCNPDDVESLLPLVTVEY